MGQEYSWSTVEKDSVCLAVPGHWCTDFKEVLVPAALALVSRNRLQAKLSSGRLMLNWNTD